MLRSLQSHSLGSAAVSRPSAFHAMLVCATGILMSTAHAAHDSNRTADQRSSAAQFRSGVDLIAVDVAVLGPDGVPVRGLQGADFDVLVDGTSRQVVSLQFLPAQTEALGPAQNPSSQSERSQRAPAAPDPFPGRRFLLLIDRDSMPFGHGRFVLEALGRFVDGLPARDRVAVWVVPASRGRLSFTDNREAVKHVLSGAFGLGPASGEDVTLTPGEALMIDRGDTRARAIVTGRECSRIAPSILPGSDRGSMFSSPCGRLVQATAARVVREGKVRAMQVLERVGELADALAAIEGPKHVLFVTDGLFGDGEVLSRVASTAERAALARVQIHLLQPWPGAWVNDASQRAALTFDGASDTGAMAGATSLAIITGGYSRPYVAPVATLDRLSRELSASYLLAVRALDRDRDGKPHRLEVRVPALPRAVIRARQQFRIQPPATSTLTTRSNEATAHLEPGLPRTLEQPNSAGRVQLAAVLDRLADYVSTFERSLAAVVMEERYVQLAKAWIGVPRDPALEPALQWEIDPDKKSRAPVFASRRMRSDVLLVQGPDGSWAGYRDIFELDHKVVRDRDERVRRLFLSGVESDRDQLQRITEESARHNLGTMKRTVNTPTFPLLYLHARSAQRIRYSWKGTGVVDGRSCAVVEFRETGTPTLVRTSSGGSVPARGRVWRIEVRVEARTDFRNLVQVTFGEEPGLDVLVPRRMWEWYENASVFGQEGYRDRMIEGLATYSNVRVFTVRTSEQIRTP